MATPSVFKTHKRTHTRNCIEPALPWPPGFTRELKKTPPHIVDAWQCYCDGDNPAENTLTSFYAPLVVFTARLLKSRRPQFFIDSVEELVSDGFIGLLKAIRDQRTRNGLDFRRRASLYIRHNMFNGAATRHHGGPKHVRQGGIWEEARATLTRQLGRVPVKEELSEYLRGKIDNQSIQIEFRAGVQLMTDLSPDDQHQTLCFHDAHAAGPVDLLLAREVTKLAKKTLRGIDRKIFDLTLDGMSTRKIADKLGIAETTARDRMNGVLWEARCRAQLAEYLECEPATMPEKKQMPSGRLRFPPIASAGPARRVG